jgi:uncharacterized protein YqgV (UPF0045/DUF77 family)
MNFSEAIEKIKVMLAEESPAVAQENAPEAVTELKFETYDLKDGTKIELSSLVIGADAMLMDESGNTAMAPDGEYELADGTMITVAVGKVEGIETPEAEAPTAEEAPMPGEMESDKFESVQAEIDYLKTENQELKAQLEAINTKFSQGFSDVIVALESISKMPSSDPIQAPKNKFALVEKKEDKIARFLERVKTLN